MLRSVPIRARLVAGFAIVMAVVLAATGLFVYERTRSDLDTQIVRELSARMAGVIAILRDDGDDLGDPRFLPLRRVDAQGIVQALGPSGEVLEATATQLSEVPVVSPQQLESLISGAAGSVDVTAEGVGRLRVIADRTIDDGVEYTALVGASLRSRDEALSALSRLLLIGGPIALLMASLAAYGVATAALRPVEEMRRRAAEISDRDPGQRLPVGPAHDEIAGLGVTLNAMLERLEVAFERERRFVADASHELRTPLAILRAEVELAMSEGRSQEDLRAALASVGEETDRLARLADDLLVLARADAGRLPVRPEQVSVRDIAARVAARFEASSGDPIKVTVADGLVVTADPARLEQALSNLVENAVRYGDDEVTIEGAAAGFGVELHVIDRGAGFPDELVGHATERFTRSDSGRGNGGTGLGLSIVDAIARAHGGSLLVANRADGVDGADVCLQLP
jgi:signal transduction histidine kinase